MIPYDAWAEIDGYLPCRVYIAWLDWVHWFVRVCLACIFHILISLQKGCLRKICGIQVGKPHRNDALVGLGGEPVRLRG